MIHHRLRGVQKGGGERYWRILANDVSWDAYPVNMYYTGFFEIRFYESTDASGENVNIGATADAKSSTLSASGANDGNGTTVWISSSSDVSPQWWSVAYSVGKTIRSIQLQILTNYDYHAKSYLLQKSSDNINWIDVSTINTVRDTNPQTFTNIG